MASFSISVPIGSYHDLLPVCLKSLAAQAGGVNVSLLDASGDPRVRAAADRFGEILSYRRHGADQGQSDAIAEGWAHAPGDILGWLNADDFLYPGAIARAREIFERDPSIDVVTGHSAICDRRGAITGYHWAVEPPGASLLSGCVISQPSCFFRRSLHDAVGGLDRSLHYTMDWDLWLRFYRHAAKFAFLNEPLSVVYWGEGTKTIGMNKARRAELERLIRANTPPDKQFRTRRGFFLRAMLDNIGSPRLRSAIEGALRRKKPMVFGIGPNGVLADRSTIYWPHFGGGGAVTIELKIDRLENVEASIAPTNSGERNNGAIRITEQNAPAEPGVLEITLRKKSAAAARLISCSEMRPAIAGQASAL